MHYNKLGSTGLFVSELCLGTMTFGGDGAYSVMGNVQQAEADALVARAFEAGINFIDTADTYSEGNSERITGQALKNLGIKRDEIVVATKVFGEVVGSGPNIRGSSRGHIMDGVKASLARLQLDYIDLYQLHGFDPATPIEETIGALNDLVHQGYVRYIGVSNWAAWQITKALGISSLHGFEKFASLQAYYTVAGRDLEREIIPMLTSEDLGLLVWSPLAGGLLSGKFVREQKAEEGSRRAAMAFPPVNMERAYNIIDVLIEMAEQKQVTVAQLAIAWLLHQPRVTSVIIGAKRLEQLNDNIGAVEVLLSDEELQILDQVSQIPAEYPGWMIDNWSQARAKQIESIRSFGSYRGSKS
ncbi:aldo/keto reductase [Paenibacillus sp. 19GGS1-52]|uniref:aldo/keto reductase n=1 Tax=Paenibacillus sp. 19GGS1-52 TaxID=2758563 RepID=UPI001EFA8BE3|nr:aldo/keto reductase [Paenibacillus sp. 19GGS1-52]ULO08162.1 aldo/keto reductase [Paenibacillus sp. 19GGS1-52]